MPIHTHSLCVLSGARALVVAVTLGLSACGASMGEAAPKADAAEVWLNWSVADGELLQGSSSVNAVKGMNVRFTIDSYNADELVIEGYDLRFPLADDGTTEVTFHAYQTGEFPIRIRSKDRRIAVLTVNAPS
ncbi:MAG: hypothetical protein ABF296_02940 [Oceanococcaceae bacterium]